MTATGDAERALELADDAWSRDDVDAVVAHLSAAVRGFTKAEEPRRAAMACVRLGQTLAIAMGNLTASRAWFTRARRHIEGGPPCVEQGWVAVAALGCDVDDPAELLAAAELALDRARRFGDVNLETKALADAGLAHVQAGRIAEGMTLLDEAMALACGPADDTTASAKSVCSFFTACYYAGDYERAGSWTELLRRQGLISLAAGDAVFLSSHCDRVQASLLVELGRWHEAEALLERAKHDFESAMGMPSWHPDIALADLRIRQGRLAEAEALLLGKDQSVEAVLPAARLHLARGDHTLARAVASRGLRAMGQDRLRSIELLTVVVDAEIARGDLAAAEGACADLLQRAGDLDLPALRGRTQAVRARVMAANGELDAAIAALDDAVHGLDVRAFPLLRAELLLELARLRDRSGDRAGAEIDAKEAAGVLAGLDVGPTGALLLGPRPVRLAADPTGTTARLARDGRWWVASHGQTSVRLRHTKGLGYLAELIARPGVERHALDLVDCIEGVAADRTVDRRALGDAGEVLDSRARNAYRHRIEQLRAEADHALEAGLLETAESKQAELEALVGQLAEAFGLGGRPRRASSTAERARLNVTRALRTAVSGLTQALPGAGEALDRAVRTGMYCVYEPLDDDIRWIVHR